ncbi:MAG: Rrf2 family transcriptional regulator [Amphiplicatus sp.]
MKRDSRLSDTLHILLHMADSGRPDASGPMTSEALALMMRTNPVVVRRTMAGLREAGLVTSEKGPGGGWTLARDLSKISLHDVYTALGEPVLVGFGRRADNPDCRVEKAVHAALEDAVSEAEAVLTRRLRALRLSDLAAEFSKRLANHPGRKTHAH